jgi:hypothetical protein
MSKHKTADAHTYHANRLLPLVGAKIVSVIVDSEDDPDVYCGLIVKMPNGSRKQLVFFCDPECNGPGHLEITDMP